MKVTGSHPQPLKRTGGENDDTKYNSSGTDNRKTTKSLARAWGEKKPELPHIVTETSAKNKNNKILSRKIECKIRNGS